MTGKPVVPGESAIRDVEDAIEHYLKEGSEEIALGFVAALRRGYAHLSRHPASGSTRFAHELNLPGLRSWPLRDYPYVVFYVETRGARRCVAGAPWAARYPKLDAST